MSNAIFNVTFAAGDECYAVLTGLDRSIRSAQCASEQLGVFANRFDKLERKVVNGSVTFDRNTMFEDLNERCIFDTLIYWLQLFEEDVVDDKVVLHPKAVVDEAVTALRTLRNGAHSVTLCEEAAWEIQECAELVEWIEMEKLEAAQAVLDRAKCQLPPNACWHGIEGHGHAG